MWYDTGRLACTPFRKTIARRATNDESVIIVFRCSFPFLAELYYVDLWRAALRGPDGDSTLRSWRFCIDAKPCFFLRLCVPTLGCSDPKGASTGPNPVVVAEQSVEGRINGQPWQFGSGLIDIEVIEDDIHYVYLFPSENARCDEPPFDQPHLILHVPKMPGEYALGPVLNVTFAFQRDDEPRYEMTFDGALVVAEYTPGRLVGAVLHGEDRPTRQWRLFGGIVA